MRNEKWKMKNRRYACNCRQIACEIKRSVGILLSPSTSSRFWGLIYIVSDGPVREWGKHQHAAQTRGKPRTNQSRARSKRLPHRFQLMGQAPPLTGSQKNETCRRTSPASAKNGSRERNGVKRPERIAIPDALDCFEYPFVYGSLP